MNKKGLALVLILCLLLGGTARAQSEYPRLRSEEDLKQYLTQCLRNLDGKIGFFYTEELAPLFESTEAVENILYNGGAFGWSWTHYPIWRRIEIENIEYYTGFRTARAWALNRTDLLGGEERLLLERAQALVEQAVDESRTPWERARWIHDEICRRTVYTLSADGRSVQDTASGVLLYGEAECDGYADAFYLLGTLAGFNVGFQHGTTVESAEDGAHLWNVIEWDGLWYHVDVTWDDIDCEGHEDMMTYRYFNVGGDLFRDHFWDEAWALGQRALYTDWNRFFYTCAQAGEQGGGVYCASLQAAAEYAAARKAQGMTEAHIMVDGRYADGQPFNEAIKAVPVYGRWTTWTKSAGKYTLFDVLFLE